MWWWIECTYRLVSEIQTKSFGVTKIKPCQLLVWWWKTNIEPQDEESLRNAKFSASLDFWKGNFWARRYWGTSRNRWKILYCWYSKQKFWEKAVLYSYYQLHNSDFARLFPAEAPDVPSSRFFDPRSVFYRLLRPELVSSHSTPLCSDTFTGWMNDSDQNKAFFKYEIIKATNRLNNIVIPQFAQFLNGFEFIKAEKIGNSKVESVPIQQQQPQHQNFIQFYLQEKNNPASNFSKPEKVAEYLQSLELKSLMPEYFSGWERKWNDIPHELSQLIDFIKVKKKNANDLNPSLAFLKVWAITLICRSFWLFWKEWSLWPLKSAWSSCLQTRAVISVNSNLFNSGSVTSE